MMDRPLTVAVAGCGSRGLKTYAKILSGMSEKAVIVAAADLDPKKLAAMRELTGIPESACYASAEEMLDRPRLADVMLICTWDRCHYAHARAALLKGYDLLLEKPIAPSERECVELRDLALERGRRVVVPNQSEDFWCIHCPKEKPLAQEYKGYQKAFLKEYGTELHPEV